MFQQMIERLPYPNTLVGNINAPAPAPANRDEVKGFALGRPEGRRPLRAMRHVQFEDFSDGDSNEDFAGYQRNREKRIGVSDAPRSDVERSQAGPPID
ncbi:hypothetical protein LWI28_011854 [Acer negundo]|uniref:Uncharacterized protein n=1 Tax=Acer negundo TaxID=4023 RepID=A0AAD5P2V8_ACENE|nr:hypothetical protein LWI28_011854 [Acer negundo]